MKLQNWIWPLLAVTPLAWAQAPAPALDWSEWGGFDKAVEMCNNNGHCRKFDAGTMCPSFRATNDEQHLTRGRANTLRLALSGQLGPDALTSNAVREAMDLCVSCKGCKRECPTGIDMAKMKIEFLHHWRRHHGLPLKERLIAYLPRYAPWAKRLAPVLNLLQGMAKPLLGFASQRSLPAWRSDAFVAPATNPATTGREVVLFVDTFSTYFDPENARAAIRVLEAAGYTVHLPRPADEARPLCCGRTFLSSGLVNEARAEAQRMIDTLKPYVERGVPVVGLEPSCLFGLRDEFVSMLPGGDAAKLAMKAGTAIKDPLVDLQGKKVGVQRASIYDRYATEVYAPAGIEVVRYGSQNEIFLDLAAGRLDATLAPAGTDTIAYYGGTGDDSIEAIANEVGYEDTSFFGRLFRRKVGVAPGEYRLRFGALRIA